MVETKEVLLIAVLAILVFNLAPGFTGQAVTSGTGTAGQLCQTNADCTTGYSCKPITTKVCTFTPTTTTTTTTSTPVPTARKETCTDKVRSQDETDIDCGGTICPKCANNKMCSSNTDCSSGYCKDGTFCAPKPSCTDGIKNQDETDIDCGGTKCAKCGFKKSCSINTDCSSNLCQNGVCINANYFGVNCVDNQKTYTFCFAIACNSKAAANTVCKQKGIENGCPRFDVIDGRTVSGQAMGSRTLTVQCTGKYGTFGQQ